jgi:hypothetical protein
MTDDIRPVDWRTFAPDDPVRLGMEAYVLAHPDGHCTDTCGCMTTEELRRRIAERPS